MRMRTILTGVLLAAGVATTWADGPDARKVLEQAQAAAKVVKAVRYEAEGHADGLLGRRIPDMHGTITLVAAPGAVAPKLRADVEMTPEPPQPAFRAEVVNDGKEVTVIDYGQKTYARREFPTGGLFLNNISPLLLRDLASDRPYQRELEAVSLESNGVETVAGVPCDVVHAVYAGDGGSVRWWFGEKDHLPRQVKRYIPTPRGDITLTTTLSTLTVDPSLSEDTFRLERPADFSDLQENPRQPGVRSSSGAGALARGDAVPDWTLATPDGTKVSLASLRGRVVLIDFWATWCGPCRMSMPTIQRLHEKYKDKPVSVYGVNCWERQPGRRGGDPVDFMRKGGFTYPQLLQGDSVAREYHVTGIPALFLIGPDGKLLLTHAGFSATMEAQISAEIDEALKSLPATTQPASPQ